MRIQLLHTTDKHTDLKPGDLGTVVSETNDTWGRVLRVKWDNGSELGLLWGVDSWKVISIDTEKTPVAYSW
jgi:hypothetical protein